MIYDVDKRDLKKTGQSVAQSAGDREFSTDSARGGNKRGIYEE